MERMNLGCGTDIKDGWVNVDEANYLFNNQYYGKVEGWNARFIPPDFYQKRFDFILINHVLCTANSSEAFDIVQNAKKALKKGGKIHVIDMDLLKVFAAYQEGRIEDIPIEEGDIDYRLCSAISGYGTRLSLYTPNRMHEVLLGAGFKDIKQLESSEYDTRPKESLIFEATK